MRVFLLFAALLISSPAIAYDVCAATEWTEMPFMTMPDIAFAPNSERQCKIDHN